MRYAFGADRMFWIYKQLMPKTYALMMGVPKTYEMSAVDHVTFDPIAESFFPLRPRRDGALFDSLISNPSVDDVPLEDISIPTLIIHSEDDPLAPYFSAEAAARRIPGARLVSYTRGGHLFLGHAPEVSEAIAEFLAAQVVTKPPAFVGGA